MKLLSLCIPGTDGAVDCIDAPVGVPTAARGQDLSTITSFGITLFVVSTFVIALFFFVWFGIRWITSGGDKQKIQSARQGIIYALIGIVLILLSFFIIRIIGQFFGIDMFSSPLRPPGCDPGNPLEPC